MGCLRAVLSWWSMQSRMSEEVREGEDVNQASGQRSSGGAQGSRVIWKPSSGAEIDWQLLKRRDPILFFDEVLDALAYCSSARRCKCLQLGRWVDTGSSSFIHPVNGFVLCRWFCRLFFTKTSWQTVASHFCLFEL